MSDDTAKAPELTPDVIAMQLVPQPRMLPAVAPPGPGLDPSLALALGLSSSPGAYALLLGSGISRAARIPTGWEVVLDLIRRVAALVGQSDQAAADPEAWWAAQGHPEPRYDTLLEMLAPSVAARRDLLHNYFEPTTQEEREQGSKQPTAAHRALAELVGSGRIHLILTTNFDRLMERALDDVGLPAQVISRPDDITGMAPLQHARATVIKLHGDYLDVDAVRNTPAELASYDPAMKALLDRVLNEYGLITLGWSGDWDTALIHAIQSAPTRRYPVYWAAHRGTVSATARRLLAGRAGHLIPVKGADQFCVDLRNMVDALARMADPPPTRAVAVATLKRNLRGDRAVELFDQIRDATDRTLGRLTDERYPFHVPAISTVQQLGSELQRQLDSYDSDTDVLAALIAVLVFHGHEASDGVVVRAVRRLAERPPAASGPRHAPLESLRSYPALRLATVAGAAAVAAGREDLLVTMLVRTTAPSPSRSADEQLVRLLNPMRVIDRDTANQMPTNGGTQYYWPWGRQLRKACREPLAEVTDDREYRVALDRYEFLRSLLEISSSHHPALGDFAARISHGEPSLADAILAEIDEGVSPLVACFSSRERAREAHEQIVALAQRTF